MTAYRRRNNYVLYDYNIHCRKCKDTKKQNLEKAFMKKYSCENFQGNKEWGKSAALLIRVLRYRVTPDGSLFDGGRGLFIGSLFRSYCSLCILALRLGD